MQQSLMNLHVDKGYDRPVGDNAKSYHSTCRVKIS